MTSAENKYKNYQGKDPMSPEQINSHEPTAIKRDPTTRNCRRWTLAPIRRSTRKI